MTNAKPIAATFVKFVHRPTQRCGHFIMEVPEEMVDNAIHQLGGMPKAGESRHVAITALSGDTDDFLEKDEI